MNQYMVEFELPETMTEEFLALIPEQREKVAEWMAEGRLLSYTLAFDRSKLWATVAAESEEAVSEMLDTFPLTPFMEAEIFELAFNERANMFIPKFSLN